MSLPHYRRDPAGTHPPLLSPSYANTVLRAPLRAPVELAQRLTEVTGPVLGQERVGALDHDLTRQHAVVPQGQRIVVHGRVLDGNGRAVPHSLVEIWQANAAGRYRHHSDQWPAPLDPGFDGLGRTMTDDRRPTSLPVRHRQAGGLPLGQPPQRLAPGAHPLLAVRPLVHPAPGHPDVLPDDPLFGQDPILGSVPAGSRHLLVSRFDLEHTEPQWALAFAFDIVLRGRDATPFEAGVG